MFLGVEDQGDDQFEELVFFIVSVIDFVKFKILDECMKLLLMVFDEGRMDTLQSQYEVILTNDLSIVGQKKSLNG